MILKWNKFKDKMPDRPPVVNSEIPVLIFINSELDGMIFDLIYWQFYNNKWNFGFEDSYLYNDFAIDMNDCMWMELSVPDDTKIEMK